MAMRRNRRETPRPARSSRRTRRLVAGVSIAGLASGGILLALPGSASADPSANDWYRLRMCESSNNYAINTGNGYYGAYQFNLSTWQSVGGAGYPNQATPAEQDKRALILYRMRGWQPWTCAGIVGLKEDKDARSGRTSDITLPPSTTTTPSPPTTPSTPTTPSGPSSSAPAWPGSRYFGAGDSDPTIALFKTQLRKRGAPISTSATLDTASLGELNRLQGQNGLPMTGLLGPVSWGLAWTGRYDPSAAPTKATTLAPPVPPSASIGPVTLPTTPSTGSTGTGSTGTAATAPAWPGPRYFSEGDTHHTVALFQAQLHKRGSFLVADGVFGANTDAAVRHLQVLNGLPATGLLGPVTWKLAWTGKWTNIAPI
jgi:peptidoglycan hydrolase-like protein with peptidoglycan-binding domain